MAKVYAAGVQLCEGSLSQCLDFALRENRGGPVVGCGDTITVGPYVVKKEEADA